MNLHVEISAATGRRKYKKLTIDNVRRNGNCNHRHSRRSKNPHLTRPPTDNNSHGDDGRGTPERALIAEPGPAGSVGDGHVAHRLNALLDSALDPHVIFRAVRDERGRVCDFIFAAANEAACAENGMTREKLVGQRLLELFPNARDAGLFERYVKILESSETLELKDFRYPHDIKGEMRFFDIRAVPMGDELAYTWRDVTGRPRVDGADGQSVDGQRPLVLERRKARETPVDPAGRLAEFKALIHRLLQKREEQRATISRELHDNIAQVLTATAARLTIAREEKLPAWLRQELNDLHMHLEVALDDVRTLARDLRPPLLDHVGFGAALEKHAQAFRERSGIALDLCVDPAAAGFLECENLTHLFRLAQEGLQNIEEHSRAERAWVELVHRDGFLHLEIGDDGCSFTPERVAEAQRDGHLGLLGMRERTELLGGRFHLKAEPGQGTVIRVAVPTPAESVESRP